MGWLKDILSGAAESTLGQALMFLLGLLASWVKGAMDFFMGWWLGVNSMPVGEASAPASLLSHTQVFVGMIGATCTIIALIRIGRNRGQGEDTHLLMEGLIRVTIIAVAVLPAWSLLSNFASEASPWLFHQISGENEEYKPSSMTGLDGIKEAALDDWSVGLMLMLLPFVGLAGLVQSVLAIGVDLMGGVLAAFLPLTAAASVISGGKAAFNKQLGWVISCALYKPVAACVLGIASKMITSDALGRYDANTSGPVVKTIAVLIMFVLAIFALPALIKLLAPMGSMVGSSAGSGFVAAVGGAASGARFSDSSPVGSSSGTSNSSGSSDAASGVQEASGAAASTATTAATTAAAIGATAATAGAAAPAAAGAEAAGGASAAGSAAGSGAGAEAAGGASAAGSAAGSGAGAEATGAGAEATGAGAESAGSDAGAGGQADSATSPGINGGSSAGDSPQDSGSSTGSGAGGAGPSGSGASSTGGGSVSDTSPAASPGTGAGGAGPSGPDAGSGLDAGSGPGGAPDSSGGSGMPHANPAPEAPAPDGAGSGGGHADAVKKAIAAATRATGATVQNTHQIANEFIDPDGAEE